MISYRLSKKRYQPLVIVAVTTSFGIEYLNFLLFSIADTVCQLKEKKKVLRS